MSTTEPSKNEQKRRDPPAERTFKGMSPDEVREHFDQEERLFSKGC